MSDEFENREPLVLTAYLLHDGAPNIRQGQRKREWMESTGDRFAYRCLPLVIANQMGWDLLCPFSFSAMWNGGKSINDLYVESNVQNSIALSHFGNGVLTFGVSVLFRTSSGHNLWVKGPPNHPKDGISPLEGIVETDWSTATFTMNWIFTRPNHMISFEKGEPFCRVLPYPRHYINNFETKSSPLESDPEIQNRFEQWSQGRRQFIDELKVVGSEAQQTRWQKDYHKGRDITGIEYDDHQTKIRLGSFFKGQELEPEQD